MLTAETRKVARLLGIHPNSKELIRTLFLDQDRDVDIEQETVMIEETPPEDAAGPDGPPNVVDQNDVCGSSQH